MIRFIKEILEEELTDFANGQPGEGYNQSSPSKPQQGMMANSSDEQGCFDRAVCEGLMNAGGGNNLTDIVTTSHQLAVARNECSIATAGTFFDLCVKVHADYDFILENFADGDINNLECCSSLYGVPVSFIGRQIESYLAVADCPETPLTASFQS